MSPFSLGLICTLFLWLVSGDGAAEPSAGGREGSWDLVWGWAVWGLLWSMPGPNWGCFSLRVTPGTRAQACLVQHVPQPSSLTPSVVGASLQRIPALPREPHSYGRRL